jgi:hypothetical protein
MTTVNPFLAPGAASVDYAPKRCFVDPSPTPEVPQRGTQVGLHAGGRRFSPQAGLHAGGQRFSPQAGLHAGGQRFSPQAWCSRVLGCAQPR